MTKTFILSIIRNLWKDKVTAAINVLTLTLGLSSTLFLYVQEKYENNFDTHQPKADRIYRVNLTQTYPNQTNRDGNTASMLAKAMRTEFPELESVVQVIGPQNGLIAIHPGKNEERIFEERRNVFYADSQFLKQFDYTFIAGDSRTALDDPSAIVLSSKMVVKYYPDFVGREAELLGAEIGFNDSLRVVVTGIIDNPPSNSNFPFQLLVSSEQYYKANEWDRDNWNNISAGMTFIVLKEGQLAESIEARLPALVDKYRTEEDAQINSYSLLNLKALHNSPEWGYAGNYTNSPAVNIGFRAVSLFILLSACINFINIQTAQVVTRSKEVGVRKVLGGTRLQLVLQFLAETLILTFISFLLALWVTELVLRGWNGLLSIIRMDMQLDLSVLGFGLLLIVTVSLISGIYPALKLSSLNPSDSLRSGFSALTGKMSGLNLRQILVVTQFVITQVLIIGTIVIAEQMKYFVEKDLGFAKEEVIMVTTFKPDRKQIDRLTREIEKMPEVMSFSFASGPPMDAGRYGTSFVEVGHEEKGDIKTRNKFVDHRYLENYEIELVAGRNFRKDEYNDSIDAFIVNEALVRQLEVKSPTEAIGKQLDCYGKRAMIVGVTRDFHIDKLDREIEPLIMFPWHVQVNSADLKIASANFPSARTKLREIWLEVFPGRTFEYSTVDEFIKLAYIVEDIMLKSIRVFSFVAILIGCLGLYGLVSFMSLKRIKEIGIRKVLGASYGQILYIFSRKFFILTLIAFLISAPLAYAAMNLWLRNYVYRVALGWEIFALALLTTLLLTLSTVGYISWKTAKANPSDTLQFE